MQRVILFVFAGRRPNLELQLPLVRRILAEHPNVEYHVWNFSRTPQDRRYVKTIHGPRITVFNQFGPMAHNKAYNTYTQRRFQDCLFVKIDDDIVFLETARFAKFVEAVDTHRDYVVTANLVNNGACAPVQPEIWNLFTSLGMHLLDIHLSNEFADMVHHWFFEHYDEMLNQPIELIPSLDWLSINLIGYDWDMMCRMVDTVGTPHPAVLAGRPMSGWGGREGPGRPYGVFGDEGVFQALPRLIMRGFTAAHLTYGPQKASDEQLAVWREGYAKVGRRYLNSSLFSHAGDDKLPGLSPVLNAQEAPPAVSLPGENNGATVMSEQML